MKRKVFLLCAPVLSATALTISACDSTPPKATIIEVDRKMPLLAWPDSNYVASLDSILALEPVKKDAKNKPNIAMNQHEMPTFLLPGSVTGKKDTPKASKTSAKGTSPKAASQAKNNGAENFAERFSAALSALQSDPSNANLYRVVEAKAGEDLFQILKRTYGAGSQNLPRFYVLSALQSVNAGVMLEHLNAGDKLRIPRM